MTAAEILSKAPNLPTVSETARRLPALLNKPDTHRDDLVKVLRCDNVLTAKLLRVCNSADAGLSEQVASIDQAVFLLGDNTLFQMVCALGYGGVMSGALNGYAVEANGLWSHSLTAAVAAEYLAEIECYGNFQPALAFTAGLLHDIGKLVINQILTPKTRTDIRNRIEENKLSRVEAEKEVLGADHAEVGALLLRKWSVPEIIVEAVGNHHHPVTQPAMQLSAVIHLANCAAHLCGSAPGWDAYAIRIQREVAESLDLDLDKVERMMVGVQNSLGAVNKLMAVK